MSRSSLSVEECTHQLSVLWVLFAGTLRKRSHGPTAWRALALVAFAARWSLGGYPSIRRGEKAAQAALSNLPGGSFAAVSMCISPPNSPRQLVSQVGNTKSTP